MLILIKFFLCFYNNFLCLLCYEQHEVVVVCLPRPMDGMGRLQFSDFFFTEPPVPPQAAGVVGTFNVLDIYPSEHYGLSFFGPYGCLFLQGSSLII